MAELAAVNQLVLSLFSGVGALDEGFRSEGFCVVSAGDLVWSSLYDIRRFHPAPGKFDGIIGGSPCQSFSSLANLVRAKGLEPSFGNLIPEFVRVVDEAQPAWFLHENVPPVPFELWPRPTGYTVASFLLDNWASLGEEQSRVRRFWFGQRGAEVAELRRWITFATDVPAEYALTVNTAHDHIDGIDGIERYRERKHAVTSDQRAVPVAIGGSGKRKASVTGRHEGAIGVTGGHAGNAPRYSLDEMIELQGLPKDLFGHSPLTMQGRKKMVGNAVAMPTAKAIAKAIRKATECRE